MILCRFENGNETNLRHVTVSSVILNAGNTQILLAKRARNLPNGGLWCLPGGYVARDETTVQAACREAFEETGYEMHPIGVLRIIDEPARPKEDKQNIEFSYMLQAGKLKKDMDKETSAICWFNLDNVPDKKEWAYDHWDTFTWYLRLEKEKVKLPIINNISHTG